MRPRTYRNYSLAGTVALLILIAIVIGGIWLWITGGLKALTAGGGERTETLPLQGIHSIRVDYPRGSVELLESTGNDIVLEERQRFQTQPLTHRVENGILVITGPAGNNWWEGMFGGGNELSLAVPETLLTELELLEITTSAGAISSEPVKADRIVFRTVERCQEIVAFVVLIFIVIAGDLVP